MEEKYIPLGPRLLVLYDDADAFVANGTIIVPESYRKQPLRGTVKAVGHGTPKEEMLFRVGDQVSFDWCHGTQVMLEGKVHLIILQEDIACAWREDGH